MIETRGTSIPATFDERRENKGAAEARTSTAHLPLGLADRRLPVSIRPPVARPAQTLRTVQAVR